MPKVCDECVRALALIGPRPGLGPDTSINTTARHPEQGTDCALCRRDPGVHPAGQLVALVLERRALTQTTEPEAGR
jgi:hypothetical protein